MHVGNNKEFDPTVFNDEVAMKTDWKPMRISNFDTRELVEVGSDLLEYKKTGGTKVLAGVLVGFPIIIILITFFSDFLWASTTENKAVVSVIGLILASSGVFLYFYESSAIKFDKQKQIFTSGKSQLRLEEIHALQIVRYSTQEYTVNQLILVDKAGERAQVHAHSRSGIARANAKRISEFLDIPVWDVLP